MASSKIPAMLLQAAKEFAQPIHLKLARCCPTMDLVAVVTEEEQLDVYRFNGQRAFGLQRRDSESKVSSICWKYNGMKSSTSCSSAMFILAKILTAV
jgi:anaphase-promoting complex subunit 4